jgi:hypothetical protein
MLHKSRFARMQHLHQLFKNNNKQIDPKDLYLYVVTKNRFTN